MSCEYRSIRYSVVRVFIERVFISSVNIQYRTVQGGDLRRRRHTAKVVITTQSENTLQTTSIRSSSDVFFQTRYESVFRLQNVMHKRYIHDAARSETPPPRERRPQFQQGGCISQVGDEFSLTVRVLIQKIVEIPHEHDAHRRRLTRQVVGP